MKKLLLCTVSTSLLFAANALALDLKGDQNQVNITRSGGSHSAHTLKFDSVKSDQKKDEVNAEQAHSRGRLADSYTGQEETSSKEIKLGRSGGSAARLSHKFE